MSACNLSIERLLAYHDGEAGEQRAEIEAHLAGCSSCRTQLAEWAAGGAALTQLVDTAVGEPDTLRALAGIRARVAAREHGAPLVALGAWWQDLWTFRRRAVAGLVAAAAMGALSAPVIAFWAARNSQGGAGVLIESMEWEGNARTVVYQGQSGATTLIWVESNADQRDPGEFRP